MEIRIINPLNTSEAIDLIEDVFMQFEAPDYSTEGINTFLNSVIYNADYLNDLTMYAAYKDSKLVGIIATRNNGNHIALCFVLGKSHKQGVGTKLFQKVLQNSTSNEISVNSSPFAIEFYHKLGFVDLKAEQVTNGLRYTPMVYKKEK